jgi:hypothetical protein
MTATFWTGSSLSFTNGSKTVTVNTGPSLDSVKANSSLTAGNYNEPVEVKSVSGNTITLYNNWPGSTGTSSATIKPSAAAAASAGVAAQQLITEIQSLVSSASVTATANSFVKRDSNGRIKASSPSANDDVVNKGYFQSAAGLNAAGIFHSGNSVNPLDYGLCRVVTGPIIDGDKIAKNDLNTPSQPTQAFVFDSDTVNRPVTHYGGIVTNGVGLTISRADNIWGQITISRSSGNLGETVIRAKDGSIVKERTVFDSGNTNFNKFVFNVNDIKHLVRRNSSYVQMELQVPFTPASATVSGTVSIKSVNSGVTVASGLTLRMSSNSSSNVALLETDSSGAFPSGDTYYLVPETTLTITING